uniref:N-acetyltransferase domain-containing protein n=2 Tax=Odontella aurita TaxID=265563 RepID=A0A7S4N4B7_9STRA|mmetsp:Transcript_46779/g.141704  ORF Transcript_46779/g.141704 Transcript_46779/m.141704 type:complete len:300 (+) Transcript_46779:231-1130(+)|eukprot:CAMPEP_0113566678 /NCGR_PEP_ID=MMETSP0015_2-20120614/22858_1 /TAXON_ID=2838 /ORGANISM="Odontella" /LENGTH=299 /DNA_ID=CAMNT_0000468997 /DNA_START=165 /DNA_END=1064 /DNA_ORIENTATION=+ /assembly_acc=CAM_ASM_000160
MSMRPAAVTSVLAISLGLAGSFVISLPLKPGRAAFNIQEGRVLLGSPNGETSLSGDFEITPSDGSPSSIDAAANFMVDAFWLQSPQNLIAAGGDVTAIDESLRISLARRQAEDLTNKYGERMGKRVLESSLIKATEKGESEILGLVAIEARLFDLDKKVIMSAEQSELVLKNAVASLGPKQRRQYKDSSASEIVAELTSPEIRAICVLSNLSVSPNARRKGLGAMMCTEAERMAKEDWHFDQIYLKVEEQNDVAKGLYESKLGYEIKFTDPSALGLRVDVDAGDFSEVPAATLVLAKDL